MLAHEWLSHDGVGVWVVPAEFLDVNYGKSIKEYLTADVTLMRVHRFDPVDVQFTDALVSSVVVLFRMGKPSTHCQVQLTTGGSLPAPQLVRTMPLRCLVPASKWGPFFAGAPVGGARAADALTIGDLFKVKRGLATGANAFFILKRYQAESLDLPAQYLRPILPSPREIPGPVIEVNGEGFPSGVPELVLLDCDLPLEEIGKQCPRSLGIWSWASSKEFLIAICPRTDDSGTAKRFGHPRQSSAPIWGGRMAGAALRFIRNKSAATAPNVYLLLYPKPRLASLIKTDPTAIERVFEALTEAAATLVRSGRVYGGGLNKIEPKELEAVHLPHWLETQYPGFAEFQLDTD